MCIISIRTVHHSRATVDCQEEMVTVALDFQPRGEVCINQWSPCLAGAAQVICLESETQLTLHWWSVAKARPSSLLPPLSVFHQSCTEAVTGHTPARHKRMLRRFDRHRAVSCSMVQQGLVAIEPERCNYDDRSMICSDIVHTPHPYHSANV